MATVKQLIDLDMIKPMNFPSTEMDGLDVVRYLNTLPTVDAVEVVHGHWNYGTRAAVCSECGFERNLDDNFGAAIACPNCAAMMGGGTGNG